MNALIQFLKKYARGLYCLLKAIRKTPIYLFFRNNLKSITSWVNAKKRLKYTQKYSTTELIERLHTMGVNPGDNIMLQSSWDAFYNYTGTMRELIQALITYIGDQGTLIMPCYGADPYHFDVRRTPSAAGLLTETFRRTPGVKRSVCANFSMCGIGLHADDFLNDHINSVYGFDAHSPCYKFSKTGGKIILLGLGLFPTYASTVHCIDYELKDEITYFNKLMAFWYDAEVIDYNGEIYKKRMLTRIYNKNNHYMIKKIHLSMPTGWCCGKLSNLDIVVCDAITCHQTFLAMARKGKVIYSVPRPNKKLF